MDAIARKAAQEALKEWYRTIRPDLEFLEQIRLHMATVVQHPRPSGTATGSAYETRVSRYDRFSAMLMASLIMTGFITTLLFLLWLTMIITFKPKPPILVPMQDLLGRGQHAQGTARDLEDPGVEELPDVTEPQLSDALEAMTDAISTQKAAAEAFEGDADAMGTGPEKGDRRAAGPGGEGDLDVVPPWQRWQIRFTTKSEKDYAEQLDFFQIELGAISRNTPNVQYVRSLSSPKPIRRSGTRDEEKRLYFAHPPNDELIGFSQSLCAKVGIDTLDRFLAQFYSDDAFSQLLAVEKANLGGRSLSNVRKTVFGVRPAQSGFEFFVVRHEIKSGA